MLLIVDDDPVFLARAQAELSCHSLRGVLFARSADHARDLMRAVGGAVTVVLVDLDLPGGGFELIRDLKNHFPDVPVIAMSGVQQQHVLESARILGASDTLRKPIGPEWSAVVARVRAGAA